MKRRVDEAGRAENFIAALHHRETKEESGVGRGGGRRRTGVGVEGRGTPDEEEERKSRKAGSGQPRGVGGGCYGGCSKIEFAGTQGV